MKALKCQKKKHLIIEYTYLDAPSMFWAELEAELHYYFLKHHPL
jgi:hypothetical protein